MNNYKSQSTTVRGNELVRRRFYLSEKTWNYLNSVSIELDTTPSMVLEALIINKMSTDCFTPIKANN